MLNISQPRGKQLIQSQKKNSSFESINKRKNISEQNSFEGLPRDDEVDDQNPGDLQKEKTKTVSVTRNKQLH